MFFLGNGDFLFLAMSDTSPCPEQTLHHIVLRGSPLEIHGAVFLHDLENLIPGFIKIHECVTTVFFQIKLKTEYETS